MQIQQQDDVGVVVLRCAVQVNIVWVVLAVVLDVVVVVVVAVV